MSKIRKSAQGRPCQVRLPGICEFNSETTVLAHLNGYGMGGKHHDFQGAYCCAACHDVIDRRVVATHLPRSQVELAFFEGIMRTQRLLFEQGLIETRGSK